MTFRPEKDSREDEPATLIDVFNKHMKDHDRVYWYLWQITFHDQKLQGVHLLYLATVCGLCRLRNIDVLMFKNHNLNEYCMYIMTWTICILEDMLTFWRLIEQNNKNEIFMQLSRFVFDKISFLLFNKSFTKYKILCNTNIS